MTAIGCGFELSPRTGFKSSFSHNTRHAVFATANPVVHQLGMDTGSTIGFAVFAEHDAYPGFQLSVLFAARALRAFKPSIVAAGRYVEERAHPAYFEHPPVSVDEPVSHFWSSAK